MVNWRRDLGLAVRQARIKRGWSQEVLAEEAGVHRTYISKFEQGGRNPSLSTLEDLADALGIPLMELFRSADRASKRRKKGK